MSTELQDAPTVASASVRTGRYSLVDLMKSEWTKLRTVRSTMWTLGLVVVLGLGLSAIACAETTAHWASNPNSHFQFDATQTSLIGVAFAQLVMGILGVMVITAEYSTGTIRATLSAAPRRSLALLSKVGVFAAVALVVSEVVSFLSYFLGQALLTSPATHTTLSDPQALRAVAGAGLYLCVIGLLALGLGTIIRHTAGAISAFVATLLVLPLIISALPNSVARQIRPYLPANIGNSMTAYHFPGFGSDQLAPWTGFTWLCVYAAVALFIGGWLLIRRDA